MLVNSQIKTEQFVYPQMNSAETSASGRTVSLAKPSREGNAAYQASLDAMFARLPAPALAIEAASETEPGHEMGSVVGTNIDMKIFDHAVAGSINGGLAFAFLDEAEGVGELTLRKYGERINVAFKRGEDGSLGGTIVSGEGDELRTTTVAFAGLDKEKLVITLRIDGTDCQIKMKPERVEGTHFINTTFSTVLDGKPVSFKLDGPACFSMSVFMNMMILGAYAH